MKILLSFIFTLFITSFMIAQPCVAITSFSVTPPTCNGSMDGAVIVSYSAGIAPYDIQLIGPPNQSYTTSTLSQNMNGLGAGTYFVLITDGNGCQTSQPVNVNQPAPLSLIAVPDATICYGQSIQIAASGTGGTPPYTYSWTPNAFVGGGPHTVNPTTTNNYTVSIKDANACAPSPKVIKVNVTPPLAVNATAISICDGASTILTPIIVSQGNGGPYTYNWSTSASTSSITVIGNAPSGPTTTTYTLVVDDGCTMPGAMTVFTVNANMCTGINELTNSLVSFYPNPTNELVHIISNEEIHAIEMTTISGQVVLSEKVNANTYTLSLQKNTEGLYLVRIIYPNGLSRINKLVKQ